MTVRSNNKPPKTTLVSVDGARLIKLYALCVWVLGLTATALLGHKLFPEAETRTVLFSAVILQVVLTIGQLRVVRRYFGGLPTLLFGVDALTNFLALSDLTIPLNLNSSWEFYQSVAAPFQQDFTTALFVTIVFGLIAWWIATTPESVIDTGGA